MPVLALALAGCGGDDEPAATTKAPPLTVPKDTTGEPTQTPTTQTTPPPATGTTSTTTTPAPATTPTQTTTQPAPDTPEGRFEKFCRENPGACG